MKKLFFATLGVTALSVAGVAGSAFLSDAQAQKKGDVPIILVINQAQLLAQSKAGKDATAQIETIQKNVTGELNDERSKLEADVKSYQSNKDLWAQDVRQQKERELQARSQYQLPQMAKTMEQILVQTVRKAENDILTEADPIMQNIVDKRGATIVLERNSVLFAAEETNITQEVISKLDKKIKNVPVKSVSLADMKKLAEETAKQNAAAPKR